MSHFQDLILIYEGLVLAYQENQQVQQHKVDKRKCPGRSASHDKSALQTCKQQLIILDPYIRFQLFR